MNSKLIVLLSILLISETSSMQNFDDLNNFISNFSIDHFSEFLSNHESSLLRNKTVSEGPTVDYNAALCLTQLRRYLKGVKNRELWAMYALDSWGKPPAGMLVGNAVDFGNMRQCLSAKYATNRTLIGTIEGQHCKLLFPVAVGRQENQTMDVSKLKIRFNPITRLPAPGVEPEYWLILIIGSCIPDICEPNFAKGIIDIYLYTNYKIVTLPGYNQTTLCIREKDLEKSLRGVDIGAISFFAIIFGLIIASTVYDLLTSKHSKQIKILIAFSFYTNLKKIFHTQNPNVDNKNSQVIHCLNGIRSLSIIWIVFAHRFLFYTFTPTVNRGDIDPWISAYSSMIMCVTVSVDTFLVLSGFLVAKSLFKHLDKYKRLSPGNILYMYVHRYIRLTPAYAVLIFFVVSLYQKLGTAPMWDLILRNTAVKQCEKYWWSALLYIQNYYNPSEMCIGPTWYLSVDFQLYLLAPLFIVPLWKFGWKFIPVLIYIMGLSMASVIAYFMVNNFTLSLGEDQNKRNEQTYYTTHTRISAWLIGVILSYIMHQTRNSRTRLSLPILIIGWTITLAIAIGVIIGIHPLIQMKSTSPVWVNAVYEAFSRPLWAIGVSWVIFVCVNGYGGFVNEFLSATFWQPIAKISYSIYLLHFMIQTLIFASTETTVYFNNISVAYSAWGDLGFTLTISLFWCMAFESPIVIIEKTVFSQPNRKEENYVNGNSTLRA